LGLLNQVINRDTHAVKCATEAESRRAARYPPSDLATSREYSVRIHSEQIALGSVRRQFHFNVKYH
jgi:hypothetical protein